MCGVHVTMLRHAVGRVAPMGGALRAAEAGGRRSLNSSSGIGTIAVISRSLSGWWWRLPRDDNGSRQQLGRPDQRRYRDARQSSSALAEAGRRHRRREDSLRFLATTATTKTRTLMTMTATTTRRSLTPPTSCLATTLVGQVARVHSQPPLTGVKKLPVDDDVLITRQQAKDLIYRLHQKERRILLEELERYESLENTSNSSAPPARPTAAQLRAICIHNGLPFIGFGFLDNFIMICAGDYIDLTLGMAFGISTMAAAGLGNAISDVAGIGSAWYVERIACRIGVHLPTLTAEQLDMTSTRIASNFGRAFGVFIGCIIGMCPLLFIDTTNKDDKDDGSGGGTGDSERRRRKHQQQQQQEQQ